MVKQGCHWNLLQTEMTEKFTFLIDLRFRMKSLIKIQSLVFITNQTKILTTLSLAWNYIHMVWSEMELMSHFSSYFEERFFFLSLSLVSLFCAAVWKFASSNKFVCDKLELSLIKTSR